MEDYWLMISFHILLLVEIPHIPDPLLAENVFKYEIFWPIYNLIQSS